MTRIICYHVGKGDLFLVLLPNGNSMLIDCYKADEAVEGELNPTDAALDRIGKEIIRHKFAVAALQQMEKSALYNEAVEERDRKKKVRINILAITHADRDHILSTEKVKEHFDIGLLMDNGRDYADPSDVQKDYLEYRKEMIKAKKYGPITRAKSNLLPDSGVILDAICPNRDIDPKEDNNNQCLVLRLEYKNKVFLFTGDTQVDDWVNPDYGIMKLHPAKLKSHFLKVSHHGSRTFFTPPYTGEDDPEYKKEDYDIRALKAIAPAMSLITCSDDVNATHPDPIALELYREHTNANLKESASNSHVYLSRETKHLHIVVDSDGTVYKRTSHSKCNAVEVGEGDKPVFLKGTVSSPSGYLDSSGIWVVKLPPGRRDDVSFKVERKGQWLGETNFDWHVLNNGQESDALHQEFYAMDSKDAKKTSSWSRPIAYHGVHLMQCHASTEDGKQWANWCVLVCYESSIRYARRWLELFPNCIDTKLVNK